MGSGEPAPPPPPPPRQRDFRWPSRVTAGIGMVIALLGSLLLFVSAYLPHTVAHKPGQSGETFSLWDIIEIDNASATTASFPIAVAFLANAMYFILRSRRLRLRGPWVLRVWALLTVVVDVLVITHLARLSTGLEFKIYEVNQGIGFYVMIVAGVVMVFGSLVAVFAPQPVTSVPPAEQSSTPPPPTLRDRWRATADRVIPPDQPSPEGETTPEPEIVDRLRALKSLLDAGLITEAEYTTRRERLLDEI